MSPLRTRPHESPPMTQKLLLAWLALAALTLAPASRADDGHNHDASPAAASGPALPRFAASSDLFELVGVVDGKRLTIYLDRFADNSPVQNAKVDLEVGGAKVALTEHEPGEFEGALADALKAGVTPVTATVVAGHETDLLAGDLDVHEDAHAAPAAASGWTRYGPWALGAAVLAALSAWWMRRDATARRARVGGAA